MHLKFHCKVNLHTPPPAIGEPVLRRNSLLPFLSVSSVLILDTYRKYIKMLRFPSSRIPSKSANTISKYVLPHLPSLHEKKKFYTSSSLCVSRLTPSPFLCFVGTNMVRPRLQCQHDSWAKCMIYLANYGKILQE